MKWVFFLYYLHLWIEVKCKHLDFLWVQTFLSAVRISIIWRIPLKMSQSVFNTDSSVAWNSVYTTDVISTDLNFVQIVSWEGRISLWLHTYHWALSTWKGKVPAYKKATFIGMFIL